MPTEISVADDGSVEFGFEPGSDYVSRMPLGLRRNKDRVMVRWSPDTEFGIADVARFTGYNVRTLQRLDEEGVIPRSTRDDSRNRRTWRAVDIVKIREHRNRTRGG